MYKYWAFKFPNKPSSAEERKLPFGEKTSRANHLIENRTHQIKT